jgi:hypothetical protein
MNGCHNRPRPIAEAPVIVQDGWYSSVLHENDAIPRLTAVPFRMSTECRYDASATDKGCAGCEHAPHLREVDA